jgi:hypothetical protein
MTPFTAVFIAAPAKALSGLWPVAVAVTAPLTPCDIPFLTMSGKSTVFSASVTAPDTLEPTKLRPVDSAALSRALPTSPPLVAVWMMVLPTICAT